jgi:Major Facilitator Superfamily
MPAAPSLITAAHPKSQRNKAIGIWAGTAGSGDVAGMLGSGGVLHFWSWHSVFWSFAGAGLTLFVLTLTIASSRGAEAFSAGPAPENSRLIAARRTATR